MCCVFHICGAPFANIRKSASAWFLTTFLGSCLKYLSNSSLYKIKCMNLLNSTGARSNLFSTQTWCSNKNQRSLCRLYTTLLTTDINQWNCKQLFIFSLIFTCVCPSGYLRSWDRRKIWTLVKYCANICPYNGPQVPGPLEQAVKTYHLGVSAITCHYVQPAILFNIQC